MKRFIDLSGQIDDGPRFAWFDTVTSAFETHGSSQEWETWAEFAADLAPGADIERYRALAPAWAFRPEGSALVVSGDLGKAMAIIREVLGETPAELRRAAERHGADTADRETFADFVEKSVTRGSWLDAADLVERYPAPVDATADERHSLTTVIASGFLASDGGAWWIDEDGGRQILLEDLVPPIARADFGAQGPRGQFRISVAFTPTSPATPGTAPPRGS